MSAQPGEFEIRRSGELDASPEEYWAAVTTGNAGWLWPREVEPREGGAAPFGGTVLAWDPAHHLVMRGEGPGGWFNQLEHVIEARDGGGLRYTYVHSGVFVDNWDTQFDGADQHTDFYLHTLGQYLTYFAPRPATWFSVDATGAGAGAPEATARLAEALGVAGLPAGASVQVDLPGVGTVTAEVDYAAPHFLGLRTADSLVRVFGREAFGHVLGVAVHSFDEAADTDALQAAWVDRLADVLG